MSVVTEHLEQRGAAFEVLPHRQASIDEARALGVDADAVLKTLAVRTGPSYALVVIPAARRLDLQLVTRRWATTMLKAGPGREVHPIPAGLTDPERPGRTLVGTALSRRSLIRMRPLVQVQPGPQTAREQRKRWSLRFDWSARSDPSRWGMRS